MAKLFLANQVPGVSNLYAFFFRIQDAKVFCFRHNAWENYSNTERLQTSGGYTHGNYGLAFSNLGDEFFVCDTPNQLSGDCHICIYSRTGSQISINDPLVSVSSSPVPITPTQIGVALTLNSPVININTPSSAIVYDDNTQLDSINLQQILSLLYLVLGGKREGVGSGSILARIPGADYPRLTANRTSPTQIDTITVFKK